MDLDSTQSYAVLTDRLTAFLESWERQGSAQTSPPKISDYLDVEPLELRRFVLIELIKVDIETRLGLQIAQPLEDYLHEHAELLEGWLPCDLIYEDFHLRQSSGCDVSPDDYCRRFPAAVAELARLFELSPDSAPTPGAPHLSDIEPGETIDDFELLTLLGKGAFARVFLARQTSLQRLVALKISENRGHEPQTLAQLEHPHIVRVFDQHVWRDRNLRLLYMQYVSGGTLGDIIRAVRDGPGELDARIYTGAVREQLVQTSFSSPDEAGLSTWDSLSGNDIVCRVGEALAVALHSAHEQGILHRDVKPANVLISAGGEPMLADFNISFYDKAPATCAAAYFGGSLAYMSPEQLAACDFQNAVAPESLTNRADLYSLAALLWELRFGVRPFPDPPLTASWTDSLRRLQDSRHGDVLPADDVDEATRHLQQTLAKSLAVDPADRHSDGREFARSLRVCRHAVARRLTSPQPTGILRLARRFPLAAIIVCVIVPHAFAGAFNYWYNKREAIDRIDGAGDAFQRVQLAINLTAFPVGAVVLIALCLPLVVALKKRLRKTAGPNEDGVKQNLCTLALRIGIITSGLGLAEWLLAGVAYPVALHA
ncbi:MAG: serine/threonine-protein kinase, partial [Pirellulaceae bacterium]|nr:serine/threonine-protein kinase [Pirellulaceae bacterium]